MPADPITSVEAEETTEPQKWRGFPAEVAIAFFKGIAADLQEAVDGFNHELYTEVQLLFGEAHAAADQLTKELSARQSTAFEWDPDSFRVDMPKGVQPGISATCMSDMRADHKQMHELRRRAEMYGAIMRLYRAAWTMARNTGLVVSAGEKQYWES